MKAGQDAGPARCSRFNNPSDRIYDRGRGLWSVWWVNRFQQPTRSAQSHPRQGCILLSWTYVQDRLHITGGPSAGLYVISYVITARPTVHGRQSAQCTLPREPQLPCCKSNRLAWSKHRQPYLLFYSAFAFLSAYFSTMAAVTSEGLPLDDRSKDLKIPIVTLIVFSSFFVGLRLYTSWRNRNFYQLTDHFLWTGFVGATDPRYTFGRGADVVSRY